MTIYNSNFGTGRERYIENRHRRRRYRGRNHAAEVADRYPNGRARLCHDRHFFGLDDQRRRRDAFLLARQVYEDLKRVNGLAGFSRNFIVSDAGPGRRPVQSAGSDQVSRTDRIPVEHARLRVKKDVRHGAHAGVTMGRKCWRTHPGVIDSKEGIKHAFRVAHGKRAKVLTVRECFDWCEREHRLPHATDASSREG
ncbi:hypothetical protein NK8_70770 (plasmid) [Caballeronia sp. NK8]|nr:hypothetical protein NK8_70770 [Caballeronia sp. NK8]